jgi:hypothetical protein
LTEKEKALQRKLTIKELREELAGLKRRLDDRHKRETAKIQAENIMAQIHTPVPATISPTQSILSLESEPRPLLNSLFESLGTSLRSVQDIDGNERTPSISSEQYETRPKGKS